MSAGEGRTLGRPRLRPVQDHQRTPQRRYVDFVTQEQGSGQWVWGCLDPVCDSGAGATICSGFASAEDAVTSLARHRAADDAERDVTTCTCKPCPVHGNLAGDANLYRFGEPRTFPADTSCEVTR